MPIGSMNTPGFSIIGELNTLGFSTARDTKYFCPKTKDNLCDIFNSKVIIEVPGIPKDKIKIRKETKINHVVIHVLLENNEGQTYRSAFNTSSIPKDIKFELKDGIFTIEAIYNFEDIVL